MPDPLLETLQLANQNVRRALAQLQGDSPISLKAGALADLRGYFSQVAVGLSRIRSAGSLSRQVQAEVSQYRNHLQMLARVLPDFHVRLLAERARLKSAIERQQAVQAWANSQQTNS